MTVPDATPVSLPALADLAETGGIVHGTTVAVGPRALLIIGASGSGKSGLALQLMAMGATLVADDRTCLSARPGGPPLATAPDRLRGLIEARGLGLLRVAPASPIPLAAVLDLDSPETGRLPSLRTVRVCGTDLTCLHKADGAHFPAALLIYLIGERTAP